MKNEEKAQEICEKNKRFYVECSSLECYLSAMEMAKWKDEQFDRKLQEIVDYVYPLICGRERLHINEIIGKDMKWKH